MSSTEGKTKTKRQKETNMLDLGDMSMVSTVMENQDRIASFEDDGTLGFYHSEGKEIPSKETEQSVGLDLRANLIPGQEVVYYDHSNVQKRKTVVTDTEGTSKLYILPGERVLIPTGLYADIPSGFWLGIYARSGTSWKKGLAVTNSVGVVDSDYVDEIKVSITNISGSRVFIEDGERIAQGVVQIAVQMGIVKLENKPQQKTRRAGGFGSTGHK